MAVIWALKGSEKVRGRGWKLQSVLNAVINRSVLIAVGRQRCTASLLLHASLTPTLHPLRHISDIRGRPQSVRPSEARRCHHSPDVDAAVDGECMTSGAPPPRCDVSRQCPHYQFDLSTDCAHVTGCARLASDDLPNCRV